MRLRFALALITALGAAAAPQAQAAPTWFRQAADIPTLTPPTDRFGDPARGAARNKGGEAAAVFDADGDGAQDVVIVNGTTHYFVARGNGRGRFATEAHLIGVPGDRRRSQAKALGLTDFDGDGRLDLYLGNTGDGTLALRRPRDLAAAHDRGNLDRRRLPQDHRYRSYVNTGQGGFAYQDIGADAQGDTRSALFADFDGDGHQDEFAFNAPYFGIWWGGSPAPSQLLPGVAGGGFGPDVLGRAVRHPHLFADAHGRGDIDVKGAVTRDFDGDGRPDVIASAYADVWDNQITPPLAPADPAGGRVDLGGDGVPDGGWQGAWRHGILVLRNVSRPGHLRFADVSRRATDEGLGRGGRMHAYETIPIDFDGDGRLDLVATGVRNFTAYRSLRHHTPLIRLYRNVSRPGRLRFEDVTRRSGLDFLNHDRALHRRTGGRYPIRVPGLMRGGGPLVMNPLLSAGAGLDLDNDARSDIVLVDRQFTSRNPLTGREFSLWVFRNRGGGRFAMIPPRRTGLTHTARDITYGDVNGDGRQDIVTVNGSGGGQTVEDANHVFLNRIRTRNRWLDLTIASRAHPRGLGARVTVYRAGTRHRLGTDEMRTDFAYRSRRDARLHFGLGRARCVDVRVEGLGRTFVVRGVRADRVERIRLPADRHARRPPGCR